MRQRPIPVLLLSVGLLVGGAQASNAAADSGPSDPAPAPSPLGSVLISPDGGRTELVPCVATPTGVECLNDDGVGMVGILNLTPPIEPRSASGTNGDIKIVVTGSGLSVTDWQTRARQYRTDGCIDHDAYFYSIRPGTTYPYIVAVNLYYGPCYQVPYPYDSIDWWTYGNVGQTGSYQDGTKLCNGWQPSAWLSGFPCITVHS